jgi:Arc/MetJ family transcription regulator
MDEAPRHAIRLDRLKETVDAAVKAALKQRFVLDEETAALQASVK